MCVFAGQFFVDFYCLASLFAPWCICRNCHSPSQSWCSQLPVGALMEYCIQVSVGVCVCVEEQCNRENRLFTTVFQTDGKNMCVWDYKYLTLLMLLPIFRFLCTYVCVLCQHTRQGKKQDVWLVVDPETGEKQTSLTTSSSESICPNTPLLYIGRTGTLTHNPQTHTHMYQRAFWIFTLHPFVTEYMVTMFDTKTQELRWNATYNDYSAPPYDEKQDYSRTHTHTHARTFIIQGDTTQSDRPLVYDKKMKLKKPWNNKDEHIYVVSLHPVFWIYVFFLIIFLMTNLNKHRFYLFYIKPLV